MSDESDEKKRRSPGAIPGPDYGFPHAKIRMPEADSKPDFPRMMRKAPEGAPNIVIVLLDDVGHAFPSTFGGLVRMPTADRIAGEGLKYCQFHVTGLCAPTRAALLTGRNHHSVSTGVVAEMATGYPGYCGILPRSCATIAELLGPNGWATGFFGKNHNVPDTHTSAAGPFDHWPHRRGWDHFYGFIGGETDQFYPALFRNETPVDVPRTPEEGYQLNRDLADECIRWMQAQKAISPDRPLLIHFAPAAAHGPHQPPLDWRGRNRGRFDMGWDRYREETLQRQLAMGVVPPGTKLSPRHAEIPEWDSYSDEEKALLSLQMENYADYLEHCDFEIGRLVSTLEALGEFENTLFLYILGDNGSSAEGGLHGTINEGLTMQGLAPQLADSAPFKEEWGLPGTWPHFAAGWAWAGDTPFQWMKQVASHFGGTRNGMVVSWPSWIADKGATRFQFHHVIDIVPTILDVVGLEPPQQVNGVTQRPIEGVSLAYTFDRASAEEKTRHPIQYFEMMGNRALYMDGWMASCRHGRLPWETSGSASFANDRWELYNVEDDFSQSEDLAAQFPDKLRELQDQFLVEAAKYNVFPLDDRFNERADVTLRPSHYSGRRELTFYPGMVRLPEGSAPRFSNTDHTITVHAEFPRGGAEGVLICMGGDMAGWSLFCEDGHLRYHYNWFSLERYDLRSTSPLPEGPVEVRLEFECDDPQKRGGPAEVRLFCNGALVAQGRIEKQVPGRFSESLDVGEDKMSPVYPGYRDRLPFAFTGKLLRIDVQLGEAAELTTGELIEEHLHAD